MADVKWESHQEQLKTAIQQAKDRALEICGGKAESYAKQLCPVDTGNLRNSITHQQMDKDTEIIGSNVEYAPFVELGTVRMAARPFLRPAAEDHGAEYRSVMLQEFGKIT